MLRRAESLFKETMAEDFPNLERDLDIQVHSHQIQDQAHRLPNKLKSTEQTQLLQDTV